MELAIPEGFAPENYPLFWLLGNWRGGGVLQYPVIEAAAYIHEINVDFIPDQPYLKFESAIWLAEETADVVAQDVPGVARYEQLTKDYLWSISSGYLRVNPKALPREDGAVEVEAMLSNPNGTAQVWFGLVKNGKLQLVTDAVARTESGADISGAKLMLGKLGSELLYAYELEAFGQPMGDYLAGRLSPEASLNTADTSLHPEGSSQKDFPGDVL